LERRRDLGQRRLVEEVQSIALAELMVGEHLVEIGGIIRINGIDGDLVISNVVMRRLV
jgi:predicted DNA-binding transcriptional regulator